MTSKKFNREIEKIPFTHFFENNLNEYCEQIVNTVVKGSYSESLYLEGIKLNNYTLALPIVLKAIFDHIVKKNNLSLDDGCTVVGTFLDLIGKDIIHIVQYSDLTKEEKEVRLADLQQFFKQCIPLSVNPEDLH